MRHLVILLTVLAIAGCGSDSPTEPPPPVYPDITGTWVGLTPELVSYRLIVALPLVQVWASGTEEIINCNWFDSQWLQCSNARLLRFNLSTDRLMYVLPSNEILVELCRGQIPGVCEYNGPEAFTP